MSDIKYNTGDWNTGNSNTGNSNTGNRNTGDWNTGYYNTGYYNTGNSNTGNSNTGYYNTGNSNTGNSNTGYYNTGNSNTGNSNTGNRNTGDWNTGNSNTGYFCVEDGPVMFFDRSCDLTREAAAKAIPSVDLPCGAEWVESAKMTDAEKDKFPQHVTLGGFSRKHGLPLNQSFPLAWASMGTEERERWTSLPNFDAAKFLKITGVDVRVPKQPQAVEPDTIVLNGVTYRRVSDA